MTDHEQRAREILGRLTYYDTERESGISYGDDVEVIAQVLTDAVAAEREACIAILDELRRAYPTDVFIEPPPGQHGETVDACSARMARHILKAAAEDIRARGGTP